MTDYISQGVGEILVSFEGKAKGKNSQYSVSANSSLAKIVPLRKAYIKLDDYVIVDGVPRKKFDAGARYSVTSTASATKTFYEKSSNPKSVDLGQTLRFALGESSDSVGRWRGDGNDKYAVTYTGGVATNGYYHPAIIGPAGYAANFKIGDFVTLESNGSGSGNYVIYDIASDNSFVNLLSSIDIGTSSDGTARLYLKKQISPYSSGTIRDSVLFNLYSPTKYSGKVSLGSTYTVDTDLGDYSVLNITTSNTHWFYSGLEIIIPASAWSGSTTWTGKNGTEVYVVDGVSGDKSFTILARKNWTPATPTYTFNSGYYAYPNITPEYGNHSYIQEEKLYSYNSLDFYNTNLSHLYTSPKRLGAVDEFSMCIVAAPKQNDSLMSILSGVDTTIYESNNYAFNDRNASASCRILSISRAAGITTVNLATPGFQFSVADSFTIKNIFDNSFNGTYTVLTAPSAVQFTYKNPGQDVTYTTVPDGSVFIYTTTEDDKYRTGSPFIWQRGDTVFFGDDQTNLDFVKTSSNASKESPNYYLISCAKDSISLYVSNKYGVVNKTVSRKLQKNRKNLITNPDFAAGSSGWTGGTRTLSANNAFYGSDYVLALGTETSATAPFSAYARDTSGNVTLTVANAFTAGEFFYIPQMSDANWVSNFPTALYGVIQSRTSTTIVFNQGNTNYPLSSYTALSVSGLSLSQLPRQSAKTYTTAFVDQKDNIGFSFAAMGSAGSVWAAFYNGATLLETRFISAFSDASPLSGTWSDYLIINRASSLVKNSPATTTAIRFYIAGNTTKISGVVAEPNPQNYNYFVGDGPKYDLDFSVGRMTGTFSPETIFNGALLEVDYWNSALDYSAVNEVFAKLRTVYGG